MQYRILVINVLGHPEIKLKVNTRVPLFIVAAKCTESTDVDASLCEKPNRVLI